MKTFKELRRELEEHPNLRARIIAKINPMDALRDKMDDLKKLPGKVADKAVDKLKDTMDKINPMSPINKMKTLADKEKIKKLQKDKEKLTTQAKGIGNKIKTLRAKITK